MMRAAMAALRHAPSGCLASSPIALQTIHQQDLGLPRASNKRSKSSQRPASTSRNVSLAAVLRLVICDQAKPAFGQSLCLTRVAEGQHFPIVSVGLIPVHDAAAVLCVDLHVDRPVRRATVFYSRPLIRPRMASNSFCPTRKQ